MNVSHPKNQLSLWKWYDKIFTILFGYLKYSSYLCGMKNIHLLPTDKPSRLKQNNITKKISLVNRGIDLTSYNPINIYITNDDEIKEGNAYITKHGEVCKSHNGSKIILFKTDKKIILTTDQDLIKDGVHAIDDEFLEWFVKNPSCEEVEVFRNWSSVGIFDYEIITPKEETKQETIGKQFYETADMVISVIRNKETLEEAAERLYPINGEYFDKEFYMVKRIAFINGAKWMQEKYEEECYSTLHNLMTDIKLQGLIINDDIDLKRWFEQFKKGRKD